MAHKPNIIVTLTAGILDPFTAFTNNLKFERCSNIAVFRPVLLEARPSFCHSQDEWFFNPSSFRALPEVPSYYSYLSWSGFETSATGCIWYAHTSQAEQQSLGSFFCSHLFYTAPSYDVSNHYPNLIADDKKMLYDVSCLDETIDVRKSVDLRVHCCHSKVIKIFVIHSCHTSKFKARWAVKC